MVISLSRSVYWSIPRAHEALVTQMLVTVALSQAPTLSMPVRGVLIWAEAFDSNKDCLRPFHARAWSGLTAKPMKSGIVADIFAGSSSLFCRILI
jgi:hypothetical protein